MGDQDLKSTTDIMKREVPDLKMPQDLKSHPTKNHLEPHTHTQHPLIYDYDKDLESHSHFPKNPSKP